MTNASRDYTEITVDRTEDDVVRLTLSRPHALNALSERMCHELTDVFQRAQAAPEGSLGAILITGSGRAFCAGADLKERQALSSNQWIQHHRAYETLADTLLALDVPLVAAVNGLAIGGGCELVLLSDVVFAASSSWFQFPETSLGIVPGMGGTQLLPRRIGQARAAEMLFSSRKVPAIEAATWGLVNRVVSDADCASSAQAFASEISKRHRLATRAAKIATRAATLSGVAHGLSEERRVYAQLILGGAGSNGLAKFWEERERHSAG